MVDLTGKNCLITGATGALGSELARLLNDKGCNLYLTGTSIKKLDKLSAELASSSDRFVFSTESDLSQIYSVTCLIRAIDSVFNPDILINSAGVFSINDIGDTTQEDIDEHWNVNVKSPYLLCQHFSKGMKERKWGKIVNIGSSSSYGGFKGGSLYCMTKHAILGLTRALYEEFKEYNVQVMCVSPGSMKSEMAKISVDQDFNTFLEPKDVAEQIVNALEMDNNMVCKELRLDRDIIR